MRRAIPIFVLTLFFISLHPILAQETEIPDEDERPPESIWLDAPPAMMYQYGEKTFTIALGMAIPTIFSGPNGILRNNFSMGGTANLGYDLFINSNIAIGGELLGLFTGTVGDNMYYLIPIGFKATFQFIIKAVEFPISLGVGVAPQKYLDEGYFGPYAKATVAGYWRFRNDWSIGISYTWLLIAQWAKNPDETAYGNFSTVSVSARFHL